MTGIATLGNVAATNLLPVLLGMPLVAVVFDWLLDGREPPTMAKRPLK